MIQIDMELPNDCCSCPFSKIEEILMTSLGFDIYKKFFRCTLNRTTDSLEKCTRKRMSLCPLKVVKE